MGGVALVLGMAPFIVNAVSPFSHEPYNVVHMLMGAYTEQCIPETTHKPPPAPELLVDRHGQEKPPNWVGALHPVVLSNMYFALTRQYGRCEH